MHIKKTHETGSLMVEVIAVIAILGIMGTMMFRHIQRRSEDLDNINMASEIRMVKEATAAYIQANKAMLEANNCPGVGIDDVSVSDLTLADVEKFLPDNWISDTDTTNGIIHEYKIYLSCYRINSPAADNRLAMYGTVVPNAPIEDKSPLPPNLSLRRAARVATLIGADGGVHEAGVDEFVGTMGAWQINCGTDGMCLNRGDNFYVATTGMDIYIPETDTTADNTVAVPHDMAFQNLHATDYFSVGDGSADCVRNYNADTELFAHETLDTSSGLVRHAQSDEIRYPGTDPCDPLFWVGTPTDSGAGHVYVRNNLYIGANQNTGEDSNPHAFAIEAGSRGGEGESANHASRALTVFDMDGQARLTLNGAGQIIGRVDSAGKGYRLDAENGEIVLFDEVTSNAGGGTHTVQVPTLRLTAGRMETSVEAEYYDGSTRTRRPYTIDPAGESLMHDIRLTSRGGALLSDILPDYILKGTKTITNSDSVGKPYCPHGYLQAIMVTPIRYSQYVKSADLNLVLTTESINGATSHVHNIQGRINNVTTPINGSSNGNSLVVNGVDGTSGSGTVAGSSLTLTQLPPVNIAISGSSNSWSVGLTYGGQDPGADDPITAIAQTYCVFQDSGRNLRYTDGTNEIGETGLSIGGKTEPGIISNKACTAETEAINCLNTEKCTEGYCRVLGSCSEPDDTDLGGNIYCLHGAQVYIECHTETAETECGASYTCPNNRCVAP